MNIDMCHVNHIIPVDDCYAFICKFSSHFIIQHLNNRYQLRHHLFQVMHRPFFQCLRQNCMIRVSTCLLHHLNGIIHLKTALHQKSNQFRNHHCRMRIIDLNDGIICQIIQIASLRCTLIQNHLRTGTYHEILLINSQLSSFFITVIRI